MGTRPTRLARNKTQFILLSQIIDFIHDPIDLKRQALTNRLHPIVKFSQCLPALNDTALFSNRETPFFELIQNAAMGKGNGGAHFSQTVGVKPKSFRLAVTLGSN